MQKWLFSTFFQSRHVQLVAAETAQVFLITLIRASLFKRPNKPWRWAEMHDAMTPKQLNGIQPALVWLFKPLLFYFLRLTYQDVSHEKSIWKYPAWSFVIVADQPPPSIFTHADTLWDLRLRVIRLCCWVWVETVSSRFLKQACCSLRATGLFVTFSPSEQHHCSLCDLTQASSSYESRS